MSRLNRSDQSGSKTIRTESRPRLNRKPLLEVLEKPQKKSKLDRGHWLDNFPAFPILPLYPPTDMAIPEEKRLLVKCKKNQGSVKKGIQGYHIIPLEVCLHSVFRFDPISRECKRCFHLGKHQSFPVQFLEAEKYMYPELEESFKIYQRVLEEKGMDQEEEEE